MAAPFPASAVSTVATLARTTRDEALAEHFDGLLVVPTAHVLAVADPREVNVWDPDQSPITEAEVVAHLEPRMVRCQCVWEEDRCRSCHVVRIAQFVRDGIPADDPHPILVDVGAFGWEPVWAVLDGNHRLFAAAMLGQPLVAVAGQGDWDRVVAALVDGSPLER